MRLEGTALHCGAPAAVELTAHDGGVVLAQGTEEEPVTRLSVLRTDFGVTLGTSDGRIHVDLCEHLFAALGGLGIRRGVRVRTLGSELPILDGGALQYAKALRTLGAPEGEPPSLVVARESTYEIGESRYRFRPGAQVELDVRVEFPPPVGCESAHWAGQVDTFLDHIAPARTFGWMEHLPELVAAGRARGATAESVLAFADGEVAPGCRPPASNECARHKLLDLCGDLAMHGGPPRGSVRADRPGHRATHEIVGRAIADGTLVRRATSLAVALALLGAAPLAGAQEEDLLADQVDDGVLDPPAPPTLPDLAHPELTLRYQYTGASIELNPPGSGVVGPVGQDRAYAWFAHAELEAPLARRRWYIGVANDLVSGAVPGIGSAALLGNPELWTRGVWWNLSGLASGGGLGIVLPVPRDLSERESDVLRAVSVVRPWDEAYFRDVTLTGRPSFDIRHVTGSFIFQFRQGVDWAWSFEEDRSDLTARATFYLGYRLAESVGVGMEVWEVYQITAEVPDDERAAVSLSPSLRLMFPVVQPAVSFLFPVATPLRGEAASYIAARLHVGFDFDTSDAPASQD